MGNAIDQIDMEKYAKKNHSDEKAKATGSIIEDLIPKKVCHFVPLKREEIYVHPVHEHLPV